ncbi:MAG: FdtA/QdtA family cupin domain-containing protein [Solirubrobacteraceae bacterium]
MTRVFSGATPASRCQELSLGRFDETRGSLCVAELGRDIPFPIVRVYWIFDVPRGGQRAHHAHRRQTEVLIAVRGGFTVHCDDGEVTSVHVLDSPATGLLLPPMVFHHLEDFASGTVCVVLASDAYDPAEYVYDRAEFDSLLRRR